jgi:excisionase family DNA binding protein
MAGKPHEHLGQGLVTPDEVARLPAALDVASAAALLGVGLTTARDLVRTGRWPSPVLRVGRQYRIPTAPLLAVLGIPSEMREAGATTPALALLAPPAATALETP